MTWNVPDRIETERLVLRVYEPDSDAPAYHACLVDNVEHLRPWMPWAALEPLSLEEHRAWLQQCADWAAEGGNAYLGLFERSTGAFVGSGGFHATEDVAVREIGYWLAADATGRGYAVESTVALAKVGLMHAKADRVQIMTRPDNLRSAAVAERCGFAHVELTEDTAEGTPMDRWIADRTWLDTSIATATPLPRLHDAHGGELPWPS